VVRALLAGALAAVVVTGCGSSNAPEPTSHADRHQTPASSPSASATVDGRSGHADAGRVRHTPLRAGERFRRIAMPGGPYTPSAPAAGKDDYRCFLVDPHLTRDTFVTGAEVIPGQPAIVHHAILFRVEPDQVAAARAHDAMTPGRGWTCFGNSSVPDDGAASSAVNSLDSAPWLAAWAPGGGESVFARGTGIRLAAGSRIVLQVHYNLRAIDQATGPDATHVRLRLAPGSARLAPLQTMLLTAPIELPCTPKERGPLCNRGTALLDLSARFGEQAASTVSGLQLLCGGNLVTPRAGPTQHCDRAASRTMVVRAVAGHMHLLGRSISVTLNPGAADERTLLDRKVWDFDNQRATALKHPVTVQPGDTLRVSCTHDAALRAMIPELAKEPPRYVMWGEGTSDEMCLGIVFYTAP
jgi:Copper type II ascorbate-dependent monooxygenase, C-terminal domain/Copper type II ascorbate-dependent monooxygenase, N-terminal domain